MATIYLLKAIQRAEVQSLLQFSAPLVDIMQIVCISFINLMFLVVWPNIIILTVTTKQDALYTVKIATNFEKFSNVSTRNNNAPCINVAGFWFYENHISRYSFNGNSNAIDEAGELILFTEKTALSVVKSDTMKYILP